MPDRKLLRHYADLLAKGRVSRREFLGGTVALGASLSLATALAAKAEAAQAPKKGGRLRFGSADASIAAPLDPGADWGAMVFNLLFGQLRNCLIEIDHENNPIPELAESWDVNADATRWVFKLRKGVEFHNGKTLDADDVLYSINHHRGEDTKSPAKALLKPVEEMKADDKHTIQFKLSGGNSDFPYVLSDNHLQIVPNETTNFEDGVGTGGYILQNYEPGVRAFTTRNPNYWKEGRAHFDEVETIGMNDVVARTNALRTGQVDVISRCDLKTVNRLEVQDDIQVMRVTGPQHYTMPMRCDTPPYDNVDVRLALKHAVDREALVQSVLRGYGAVGNDHPIGPRQRFFAAELPQRTYDPDKAKWHVKRAGAENATFMLHAANAAFEGAIDAAVLIKEHAAKAGINIEVAREPDDGYWANVWMKKPWTTSFWQGRPTADWMFSIAYAGEAPWNESFWKNERFDQLLLEARVELDEKMRYEMYAEMQELVHNDGGELIPMFADFVYAAKSNVKHGPLAANWELDGHKCAERWWFG